MKQKVAIFLEPDVLRRAERRAMEEGRPFIELVHDALERYLSERMPEAARREVAYRVVCEQPLRLSPRQLRLVLGPDR
jgi:cytidylate kinase